MKKFDPGFTKGKWDRAVFWGSLPVYFVLFLYILIRGVHIYRDSEGYLDYNMVREPVYPIFVNLMSVFGELQNNFVLLILQALFAAAAIFVFCRFLLKQFDLPYWIVFAVALLLCAPFCVFADYANSILSEAIAFPLYLVALRFLLDGLLNRNLKSVGIYFLLTIPLILTRGQFLFLHPVGLLVLAWLFFSENERRKTVLVLAGLFVVCAISTNLIERTYHLVLHGRFVNAPATGYQLAPMAFYCAKPEDADLFTDPTEKRYFQTVFDSLTNRTWTQRSFQEKHGEPGLQNLNDNYNYISHRIIKLEARKTTPVDMDPADAYIAINAITMNVSKKLILANPVRWGKLYVMNLFLALGGRRFSLLVLLSTFLGGFYLLRRRHPVGMMLLLSGVIVGINAALVALVEPGDIYRYLYHADLLWVITIVLALFMTFNTQPQKSPDPDY